MRRRHQKIRHRPKSRHRRRSRRSLENHSTAESLYLCGCARNENPEIAGGFSKT
jgi:hypothetical protein